MPIPSVAEALATSHSCAVLFHCPGFCFTTYRPVKMLTQKCIVVCEMSTYAVKLSLIVSLNINELKTTAV